MPSIAPHVRNLTLALILAVFAASARADTLVLKDGTTLEGTVIKKPDGYWIRTTDGQTRNLSSAEVKSHTTGKPASTPGAAATGSADFTSVKRKADGVETPLAAVILWQKFIDSKPAASDLASAKSELDRWQKLHDTKGLKINGKWLMGDDAKKIVEKAEKLLEEGRELMTRQQTLDAIKKFEEANKVYAQPETTSFLGYIALTTEKYTDAIKHFEHCLKLMPNNVDALNNLGAAYVHNEEYIKGIECIYKAVKARDSKELAQNLVNAIAYAPDRMRGHNSIKGAEDAARLLAGRYGIGGPTVGFFIIPPSRGGPRASSDGTGGSKDVTQATLASGTGFIIADDGLILTNRHVVGNEKAELMVLLPGGEQKAAEIVKIDTEQDLALIRVKVDKKLPVAHFAALDLPGEGADCFVLGYPLMDRMGSNIKITKGIVSGLQLHLKEADIVTDAKVNPGNSGGPMVNSQGHIMGIVTLKTYASVIEDSYGMAISTGRIRKFLQANDVKLPPTPPVAAGAPPLIAEQVAAKLKPATVCILSMGLADKK